MLNGHHAQLKSAKTPHLGLCLIKLSIKAVHVDGDVISHVNVLSPLHKETKIVYFIKNRLILL